MSQGTARSCPLTVTCPSSEIPRTCEAGIARAKADGKHCGRPPIKPELAERIREALSVSGRPGIRVIAKQFGVSPMTVQNVARG